VRPELDRNLLLLRPAGDDRPVLSPEDEADIEFASETEVQAFPNGAPELCVLPVFRTPAILLTPTCDLPQQDFWLFSPLRSVAANSAINRNTLHSTSKGYGDLFGVYAHPEGTFEESFVSFHDLISVPSEPFRYYPQTRVVNLSKEAQHLLADKFARFVGRGWGYAPDERVEKTGYYRCRICSRYYGLPDKVVFLSAGDFPPPCENCSAIGQNGSWELLLKHKNSTPPDA